MVSAIGRVLDPGFAEWLGKNARARVVADYAWGPSLRLLDDLVTPLRPDEGRWCEAAGH